MSNVALGSDPMSPQSNRTKVEIYWRKTLYPVKIRNKNRMDYRTETKTVCNI